MMPGCGKSATSGASLPWTRVLISWLKLPLWANSTSTSFSPAQALTSSTNPVSCAPVKAYMTSMLRLVLALPPPPPPPPPSLRQPVVRTATAPSVAPTVMVDLVIMCTPSDTGSVGTSGLLPAVRRG
jgi:hypothetical protein